MLGAEAENIDLFDSCNWNTLSLSVARQSRFPLPDTAFDGAGKASVNDADRLRKYPPHVFV
ncbi:hypothetical protein ACNKHT_22335 [Shigella flexneri]